LILLLLLYVFLIGVNGLGAGFKGLGGAVVDSFFRVTSNPFVALVVGLLATTLVQSSSVTTSLIVGLVAAPENPLPVANAVPMVMGANIGTTVTNTIVSLAHMGKRDEFRRAFAVATCHDFFNIFTVMVLLPLEIATGYLRHSAEWISAGLVGGSGVAYRSPIEGVLNFGLRPFRLVIEGLALPERAQGIVLIALSGVMIYGALLMLVRTSRALLKSRMEGAIFGVLDRSPLLALAIGLTVTAVIQSSSITTSLLVPLGGAGLLTLEQAFPVTIGANIGTTVTALMASLAVTGPHAAAGITIALVHLLFNLSGTVIIYPLKPIRNIPLAAARWLAGVAARKRWVALSYVLVLFYLLPMLLAVLGR
jgi:sodium-dependent phosphate cotransporter